MGQSQLAFFCLVRRRLGAGGKGRRPSKWNSHGGLCEQAAFLRVTCGGGGGLGVRPRFQRFHDSTLGNGLHEIVLGAFRGIVGIRGNRAFVAFVGTVGFVGIRGIVISLLSLESLYAWKPCFRWNRGHGAKKVCQKRSKIARKRTHCRPGGRRGIMEPSKTNGPSRPQERMVV